MAVREIKNNIFHVGSIDWDRRLFDQLIPLPHGTSYNSYLIKGSEKTALIDTVYPPKLEEFIAGLKKSNINRLDYIVINHSEQDHSGSLPAILEMYPEAQVLTNSKCKELLIDHLHIDEERISLVNDSTEISLGDKTLKFMISPWVHWPDTMFTYIPEDKIIFTCDFMGSHFATSDLYVKHEGVIYEAAKRYYAEIMMPFKQQVKKYTEQLKNMDIEIIAPSHGPLYDKPKFIIDAYSDWASDDIKGEVIIPYVSMYKSTDKMVKYLADKLMEKGVKVTPFNLTETDLGELAISLVDATTIVFGASMVLAAPHPAVIYAASIINALRPKAKFISSIGSYGWAVQLGEKMDEQIKALMPAVKAEKLSSVFVKGLPTDDTYIKLDNLAEEIFNKHKAAM
ncbi:MAG TPA: FprA family A-type flavoprotein [Candidatus Gastranaerophilales bacterium]|nr:FprA family A-type flavoprotein [Candidatus Gastranaerophilales bacterium]